MAITNEDVKAMVLGMAPVLREHIQQQLDPIRARLDALDGNRTAKATKPRVRVQAGRPQEPGGRE